MRGQGPVVAALLLVVVSIGLAALAGTFVTSTLSTASETGTAAQGVGAGMVSILDAEMTTPYTWRVLLQNLTDANLDLTSLKAVVYKDGSVCGVSSGIVGETVLPARGVVQTYFYGDLDCRLGEGDWKIQLTSPTGFSSLAALRPADVYLWIPFKSVHDMDWSGKHRVYFHSDTYLATFYGYNDGNAVGFDWTSAIQPGRRGDALLFDRAVGTYVVTETNSPLKGVRALTICAWAYPTESGDYRCVVDSRSDGVGGGHTGVNIYLDSSEYWAFWYGNGATYSSVRAPDPIPSLDRWYFVCGRIEEDNTITLFVDGVPVAQRVDSAYVELNADVPVIIGGIGTTYASSYFFPGLIDDVRIYRRALSDDEIRALYRGEDVRDGLVLYYTFDRNTIDTDNNRVYDVHMWGPGAVGGGAWLDGNSDRIEFQADLNYLSTPFTYVAWVRQMKNDLESVIMAVTTAKATIFTDTKYGTPCAHVDYNYSGPAGYADVCVADMNVLGKDALIALTYDPNAGVATVCAGVEGYFECNSTEYNAWADAPDPNLVDSVERIGTQWGGAPARMWTRGLVDEVRVYKRALSQNEIRCIYEDPECLIGDENLVVHYTFDYPDKAWGTVPNWHQASRTVRFKSREAVIDTASGDRLYIPLLLPAPHAVLTAFRPLVDKPTSTIPHIVLGFGSLSGTEGIVSILSPEEVSTSGSIPANAKYCTLSGDCAMVQRDWNVSERYVLGGAYDDGTIYAFFEENVETNSATYTPKTDIFYVGLDPGGSSAVYGTYTFLLALNRLPRGEELNAICRLFGTC